VSPLLVVCGPQIVERCNHGVVVCAQVVIVLGMPVILARLSVREAGLRPRDMLAKERARRRRFRAIGPKLVIKLESSDSNCLELRLLADELTVARPHQEPNHDRQEGSDQSHDRTNHTFGRREIGGRQQFLQSEPDDRRAINEDQATPFDAPTVPRRRSRPVLLCQMVCNRRSYQQSTSLVFASHVVIRLVKIKIAAYKASAEPNVFQQAPVFLETAGMVMKLHGVRCAVAD